MPNMVIFKAGATFFQGPSFWESSREFFRGKKNLSCASLVPGRKKMMFFFYLLIFSRTSIPPKESFKLKHSVEKKQQNSSWKPRKKEFPIFWDTFLKTTTSQDVRVSFALLCYHNMSPLQNRIRHFLFRDLDPFIESPVKFSLKTPTLYVGWYVPYVCIHIKRKRNVSF